MKPIDFVKDNNIAYFQFYRQGIMYFNVKMNGSTEYYQFQVPLTDLGDATIGYSEKAIMLMRYIRKSIDDGTMIKVN